MTTEKKDRRLAMVVDVNVAIAAKTEEQGRDKWAESCLQGLLHNGGEMVIPASYIIEAVEWARHAPVRQGNKGYMSEVKEVLRELGEMPMIEIADTRNVDIERYCDLVARAFTTRDAMYIELAERLQIPVLTTDQALARGVRNQKVGCQAYTPEEGTWDEFAGEMQRKYQFTFTRDVW